MESTKQDRKQKEQQSKQFQRTDGAIIQAMIRLLRKKSFDRITVADLLEETPVSKGTFYAHYKDKYAVAERMQEMYMELQHQLREEMGGLSNEAREKLTRRFQTEHQDLYLSLMNIHTETVDIMRIQQEEYEAEYRSYDKGRHCDLKAAVYAETMIAFQEHYSRSYVTEKRENGGNATDLINEVMIDVFLHILKNDDNDKLRRMLKASLK